MKDHDDDGRQAFADEQFELQLEFEELTDEQLRERGRAVRDGCASQGRDLLLYWGFRVWLALLRSPILHDERPGSDLPAFEEMFDAFCDGFGFTRREIFEAHRQWQVRDQARRGPDDSG